MWRSISQQLSETLMFDFQISEKETLNGGDVHHCYCISGDHERYFVKTNSRDSLPLFEAEADNIRTLRDSRSLFLPEVILCGTSKNHAFLILNYLATQSLTSSEASYVLGEQLATLHQWGEQKEYGFDDDNYLGTTLQPNRWHKKWSHFFAEQRIGWQLQLAQECGLSFVDNIPAFVQHIQQCLAAHTPRPSLLHGNFQFSNVAHSALGPISYNPASYWGDRECDLACAEWSGEFLDEFYQGYQSVYALDEKYEERRPIYQLYYSLNHCLLYGGHHLARSEQLIHKILYG